MTQLVGFAGAMTLIDAFSGRFTTRSAWEVGVGLFLVTVWAVLYAVRGGDDL